MKPQNPYIGIIPLSQEEETDLRLLKQGWEEGFKAFEKWITPNDFQTTRPHPGQPIVVVSRLDRSCHSTIFNPTHIHYESCYLEMLINQQGESVSIVGTKWLPLSTITDLDQ